MVTSNEFIAIPLISLIWSTLAILALADVAAIWWAAVRLRPAHIHRLSDFGHRLKACIARLGGGTPAD
jgi:hypothetical protein